ncbi:MAG: cyanophycinase [Verrucomicrobiota bacterium]
MTKKLAVLGLVVWLAVGSDLVVGEEDGVAFGPAKGALVIVGGGDREMRLHFGRFMELAGGEDAKVVIVPTAGSTSEKYDYDGKRRRFVGMGLVREDQVKTVHTHNRVVADSEEFVRAIREADGVWFAGGRQWRLVDAYGGTLAEEAFHGVLERGGVIGGSSAGATIQGSFLVRGDTSGPKVLTGDHQRGFGFLRNSAIDQHLFARGREFDLIKILLDEDGKMDASIVREDLLGIGVDEDTALVVQGDLFEVTGKVDGAVVVYDPRKWTDTMPNEARMEVLGPGSRYDFGKREVIRRVYPAGWEKKDK